MSVKSSMGAMLAGLLASVGLLLAVTAPASGATRTYFGQSGNAGIQLKVKEKRSGLTVTSVGVADQVFCESGFAASAAQNRRINKRIGRRGGFEATSYKPQAGAPSILNVKGDLKGRRISGVFSFTFENDKFGSCTSGVNDFVANRQDRR